MGIKLETLTNEQLDQLSEWYGDYAGKAFQTLVANKHTFIGSDSDGMRVYDIHDEIRHLITKERRSRTVNPEPQAFNLTILEAERILNWMDTHLSEGLGEKPDFILALRIAKEFPETNQVTNYAEQIESVEKWEKDP